MDQREESTTNPNEIVLTLPKNWDVRSFSIKVDLKNKGSHYVEGNDDDDDESSIATTVVTEEDDGNPH
jgi:hypothetical protein